MEKGYINDILLILSSIGVVNCLFAALYLLFASKFKSRISVKLLALLFLMLVIRIGKSVAFYFYRDLDGIIINIGVAAFACIGPFFYLLVLSLINGDKRLQLVDCLHFIPALAVLTFAGADWLQHGGNPIWLIVYRLILVQILLYFLISFERMKRSPKEITNSIESLFIPDVFRGLLVIWLSYFIDGFYRDYPYVLNPLLFTLFFYFLAYKILTSGKIQGKENFVKYKNINLDPDLQQQYVNRIFKVMEDENIYLKNQLTLTELAKMVTVSPQILSYILNNYFNHNFSDFINSYRIQIAKKMLNNPEYSNLTISSIALECGFNSISVFNTAFKKFTGMTPSEFRNSYTNC